MNPQTEPMDAANPRPSKIRKRANKACLACRARKVRCDVSQRGRPCMNCFLDSEACVVVGRASRRPKTTGEEASGDVAPEDTSTHAHRHESDELRAEGADDEGDGMSDGGSYEQRAGYERDATQYATSGFSAVNTAPSARLSTHTAEHPSPHASMNGAPRHEAAPQPHHPATKARPQQLQWTGEQTTLFGFDVLYSYYPFLEVRNLPNVLPQDVSYLEMQGCFRVPTKTILDDFVKQYFLHVHPILPLINESDFWDLYGPPPAEGTPQAKLSLLVFQAMLFASCAYVPRHRIRALGYPDMKTARAALHRRAKLLFDFEVESSPVATAQAALLLSSWSPSGSQCGQACSFWLGTAIQQARLAGAHRYTSLYGNSSPESHSMAALKRRKSLKRLWWCIILADRILSLYSWRPVQLSRLHLHPDLDSRCPFDLTDFADEIERSRVYNSGAKRTLIELFIKMTDLAALLTELLAETLPMDEGPHWDHGLSDQEKDRIQECKDRLNSWYDEASGILLLPPRRSLESERAAYRPEIVAGYSHDSVVLYTNYLCLLYQSAMMRLCHHECMRMVAQARRADPTGTSPPQKSELVGKQREMQNAAFGVVKCVTKLTKDRLSRWLPVHTFSHVSLPLIISIIDVKLSPSPGTKVDLLHDLHESVRVYHPQIDTTDSMSDTIRKILDLSSLDRAPPPNDIASAAAEADGPHPSLYFRMAMGSASQAARGGFLGETSHVDIDLLRLFGSGLVNELKPLLSRSSPAMSSTPAAHPRPAPNGYPSLDHDQVKRQIAAWTAIDGALNSELGMVSPPDLTAGPAGEDSRQHYGPGMVGHADLTSHAAGISVAAQSEMANRAFSEIGDAREAAFLDAFAFRDQIPRAGGAGAGQVDWAAQELGQESGDVVDREAVRGVSPEATVQDRGDIEVARLASPEQFWNECFQQMKSGAVAP